MDLVFEPDRDSIRDKRSIVLIWTVSVGLMLLVIWVATLLKISVDLDELQKQSALRASARARVYAEQLRRTAKEIDQISLTVKYQWQNGTTPLNLADQYEKAMHHTPTYPAAIGADGKVQSSWRQASIGIDMSGLEFFPYHRAHDEEDLRINPPSAGIGGLSGKRTVRFTRRVNDAKGNFGGVVMVSTEPGYLASLSQGDEFNDGDFISVRLIDGPFLVAKTVGNREVPKPFYIDIPRFETSEGLRKEPGELFHDHLPRHVAWQNIEDYRLVAIATITEDSAVKSYAPTKAAYLIFATVITGLTLLAAIFGSISHIRNNERRRKAERIRSTFRMAVDGAHEAFYMIDPIHADDGSIVDYRIEDCNDRAAEIHRMQREEIIGKQFTDIYPKRAVTRLLKFFNHALELRFLEDEFAVSEKSRHQSGWYHRRAVRSGEGLAVTIRDITATKQQEETLAKLAITDALTGLPNRRWLNEYLPDALARSRGSRTSHNRIALLFIDLDNFKKVNDTLGHAAGDTLLIAAAGCLKSAVRDIDHVVRLGGDEFTVLIENLERDADAELVAAQIISALSESESFARWNSLDVKCSIGIALYPAHAQDADRLLHCADEAMYAAKAAGKGCYRVFDPASSELIYSAQ